MLKWIRDTRFDLKTTVIVLVIAGLIWAVFIYVNIRDFVPEELTEPVEQSLGASYPARTVGLPASL